jgi:hypothetical protein
MRARDRFLLHLYDRTGGRTDHTVHAYLHVAKPLALSLAEMRMRVDTLIDAGLIEADPGFDRLIRLTPAGVAICARRGALNPRDTIISATPSPTAPVPSFVVSPERGAPPIAGPAHGYIA